MHWHAEEAWHEADPSTLSDEQKIAVIIDVLDQGRIDSAGGYPSEYSVENGRIYLATLAAGKEYRAPELVVQNIADFIDAYPWVFDREW